MRALPLTGLVLASVAAASALPASAGVLPFERRLDAHVALQRARDEMRGHTALGPRAPFDERLSRDELARRVERELAMSAALAGHWNDPITDADLQAELERMARSTTAPAELELLLAALGRDPWLAAECLARPALAARRVAGLHARDGRIHSGSLRESARILEELRGAGAVDPGARARIEDAASEAAPLPEPEARRLRATPRPGGGPGWIVDRDDVLLVQWLVERQDASPRLATVTVPKVSVDAWLAQLRLPHGWREPGSARASFRLPDVAGGPGLGFHDAFIPDPRYWHTTVWSGSEMIVWGGYAYVWTDSGSRYDAATDSWRWTTTAGAPSGRAGHTAVWTGTEMIVWGGGYAEWGPNLDTGARYDPVADAWRPMATTGAPAPRYAHTMLWTGTEAIVWGGRDGTIYFNDGGRYDPASDSWKPVRDDATTPPGRYEHTAVWTGSEMIVWGGRDGGAFLGDGGRYDPVADGWTRVSDAGAPAAASQHVAVWSGQEMIVWGTGGLPNGGAYDPALDAWRPIADAGAPGQRRGALAVWTGSRMVVWGGDENSGVGTGGVYDPLADAWSATSTTAAPSNRDTLAGVWTGSELIVFGGYWLHQARGDGGRYDPAADTWRPLSTGMWCPSGRVGHSSVWTGAELLVWGGGGYSGGGANASGGRYDVATDAWSPTSQGPGMPSARASHETVWTGSAMLVFGGGATGEPEGGAYDPATDAWQLLPPSPLGMLYGHSATWTGREMIVWGGQHEYNQPPIQQGMRYDPSTRLWRLMLDAGAPSPRQIHTAVWTGGELVVWGGLDGDYDPLGDGARYAPSLDAWAPMASGPTPRYRHAAFWTGTEMLVFGAALDAARYAPATDSWTTMALPPDEACRNANTTTTLIGDRLLVWGGYCGGDFLDTGGIYDPATDSWSLMSRIDAPMPRSYAKGAWTGSVALVWGGTRTGGNYYADPQQGGAYDPRGDVWLRSAFPIGGDLVLSRGPGGVPAYDATVTAMRADAAPAGFDVDPFPAYAGHGSHAAGGDLLAGQYDEVIVAPGGGATFPPRVRGFDRLGLPLAGLDLLAYGAAGMGARVGVGRIDAGAEILTGPGPSPVYGPHVRAFAYDGVTPTPIAAVGFFAYGTLRYGVSARAGDVDRDGYDEILTGAGPGSVFGPHVRGFDYDGKRLDPIAALSFFAYGTPRYGVEVAAGDVGADGADEIVTGPGPSPAFPSHLRGFSAAAGPAQPIPWLATVVWSGATHGLNVAAGDVDGDDAAEVACGGGPDPLSGSRIRVYRADGVLQEIPALSVDVFGLGYGVRVGVAELGL